MQMVGPGAGNSQAVAQESLTLRNSRELFQHDAGHGESGRVGDRQGGMANFHGQSEFCGSAVKLDGRSAAWLADYFNFKPTDSVADPSAKGLGSRLFSSETGRQTLRDVAFAQTVCLFGRRVYAVQKS